MALNRLEQRQQVAATKAISSLEQPKISSEIFAIRNTLQLCQQSINRIDHRQIAVHKSASTTGVKTGPTTVAHQRKLINNIYNRSPRKRLCNRHREFGSATSIQDCPGPDQCSFVPQNRAQRRLEKFGKNINPVSIPTNVPSSSSSTAQAVTPPTNKHEHMQTAPISLAEIHNTSGAQIEPMIVNPSQPDPNQQIEPMTTDQQLVTTVQQWSDMVDLDENHEPADYSSETEEELLDVSI